MFHCARLRVGRCRGLRISGRFGHGFGALALHRSTPSCSSTTHRENFRIDGHCQSACTLFLAIRNVCIEPTARLLFHAGHTRGTDRQIHAGSTNHMLAAYNGRLRSYLQAGGYMNTLAFHTLSGQQMISKFGYRACR